MFSTAYLAASGSLASAARLSGNCPRVLDCRHHDHLHLLFAEQRAQEKAELKRPVLQEFDYALTILRQNGLAVYLDVERLQVSERPLQHGGGNSMPLVDADDFVFGSSALLLGCAGRELETGETSPPVEDTRRWQVFGRVPERAVIHWVYGNAGVVSPTAVGSL